MNNHQFRSVLEPQPLAACRGRVIQEGTVVTPRVEAPRKIWVITCRPERTTSREPSAGLSLAAIRDFLAVSFLAVSVIAVQPLRDAPENKGPL
jgi:hypothetical protein